MNNKGNNIECFMLVLSSPSGAGKTALAKKLLKSDNSFNLSISVTTRTPRNGEINGKDYFFVNEKEFEKMVENNELLEFANVFSHKYGTKKDLVKKSLKNGKNVLFDIDWQGTKQLKDNIKISNQLVTVFILPPSLFELNRRLKNRALDSEQTLKKRMFEAEKEISHWVDYDYVIINDDFEKCFNDLHSIIRAEKLKKFRQISLEKFTKFST
ncbi:MAG: Guanylate kinase [Alphaproteobacteria bacterium MarineAlpha2_Bin1]|nr:MAG: Guanylate kinase [Alphaproteobacteria bacterium MarineAlpha2_Bin1]